MGATPSHEDQVPADDPEEDSDDEDVIKMQNGRFRVSWFVGYTQLSDFCLKFVVLHWPVYRFLFLANCHPSSIMFARSCRLAQRRGLMSCQINGLIGVFHLGQLYHVWTVKWPPLGMVYGRCLFFFNWARINCLSTCSGRSKNIVFNNVLKLFNSILHYQIIIYVSIVFNE